MSNSTHEQTWVGWFSTSRRYVLETEQDTITNRKSCLMSMTLNDFERSKSKEKIARGATVGLCQFYLHTWLYMYRRKLLKAPRTLTNASHLIYTSIVWSFSSCLYLRTSVSVVVFKLCKFMWIFACSVNHVFWLVLTSTSIVVDCHCFLVIFALYIDKINYQWMHKNLHWLVAVSACRYK